MSDPAASLGPIRSEAAEIREGQEMGSQMDRAQQSEAEPANTSLAPAGDDEFMTTDELGSVIDDLRSGRRPAIVEDQEP